MKNNKTILLTGDDGFASIGTRVLVHHLRDDYQLFIGGTSTQQSAMGGRLNLKGGNWGEKLVDGVPAIWVDGSPVDAVGAAYSHFGHAFDMVVSGINLGANIGGANISSGTFSAAFRALNAGITKQAIAISWDITPDFWFKKHNEKEDLTRYIKHPGQNAIDAIRLTIKNKWWNGNLVNINVPQKKGSKICFTLPMANVEEFYAPISLDRQKNTYYYPNQIMDIVNTTPGTDLHELQQGNVTISLCRSDFMDMKLFKKVQGLEISTKE